MHCIKSALYPGMHLKKNAQHPIGDIYNKNFSLKIFCLPLQKSNKRPIANFQLSVLGRSNERQDWSSPKERDQTILRKNFHLFVIVFRQIRLLILHVSENSMFLMLLNMLVNIIPQRRITSIRVCLPGLIMLDFVSNAFIIRIYAIMFHILTKAINNLLRPQG